MRWQGTVDVAALDVELVRRALAVLLDRLRTIDVVDGAVLSPFTGAPSGVRVVGGCHPEPGSRYEVTEHRRDTGDAPPSARTTTIEVVADEPGRLVLGQHDGRTAQTITISDSQLPTTVTVVYVSPGGTSCLTRGEVVGYGMLDLDRLVTASAADSAPLVGAVKHRSFELVGSADPEPIATGWRVTVTARVRGRGVLRPLTAAASVALGRVLRRHLDGLLSSADESVRRIAEELRPYPTPDALADHWLRRMFDEPSGDDAVTG